MPDRGTCMGRMQISGFTDDAVYHCFSGSGLDPSTGARKFKVSKKQKKLLSIVFCAVFYGLLFLLAAWASLKLLDGVENLIRQVPHFYNTTIVPVFETISNYLEESTDIGTSFCGKYH